MTWAELYRRLDAYYDAQETIELATFYCAYQACRSTPRQGVYCQKHYDARRRALQAAS
jgi:hypothetical protein